MALPTKERLLDEIRRTTELNGGTPLGQRRFTADTGIPDHTWRGASGPRGVTRSPKPASPRTFLQKRTMRPDSWPTSSPYADASDASQRSPRSRWNVSATRRFLASKHSDDRSALNQLA